MRPGVSRILAEPDAEVMASKIMSPGYGVVPCNGFGIMGAEPVLANTGSVVESVMSQTCGHLRPRAFEGERRCGCC